MAALYLERFSVSHVLNSASNSTRTKTKASCAPRISAAWQPWKTGRLNPSPLKGDTACKSGLHATTALCYSRRRPSLVSTTARSAATDLSEAAKSAEWQPSVQGTLDYLKPPAPEEQLYLYVGGAPPADTPPSNLGYEPHEVDIVNILVLDDRPTIEHNGFELVSLKSPVTCNFKDEDEVQRVFYPLVSDVVREATGASLVLVFRHQLRMRPEKTEKGKVNSGVSLRIPPNEPVGIPHCDYTEAVGAGYLQQFLGEGDKPLALRRGAVVNFWMIINGPTLDAPLALCDPKSVEPSDRHRVVVHVLAPGPPRDTSIYAPKYIVSHKWYYAPNMGPNEALIFKGFDTEEAMPQLTPHGAFHHPSVSDNELPRESIECRMVVAWD